GLNGPKTRRAVRLYREDRGLGAGDTLDGPTKAALDAESLPPLERRVILEGDDAVADVHDNPLPAPGTRKKLFTYCDGSISPGSLPYRQKFGVERDNLVRAHLPLQVKALVRRSDGTSAFSPEAVQGVKISFK